MRKFMSDFNSDFEKNLVAVLINYNRKSGHAQGVTMLYDSPNRIP